MGKIEIDTQLKTWSFATIKQISLSDDWSRRFNHDIVWSACGTTALSRPPRIYN